MNTFLAAMCFSKETECFFDPHFCEGFHLVPLLKCSASPETSSPISSSEIIPVIQGPTEMPHFHEVCLYSFTGTSILSPLDSLNTVYLLLISDSARNDSDFFFLNTNLILLVDYKFIKGKNNMFFLYRLKLLT